MQLSTGVGAWIVELGQLAVALIVCAVVGYQVIAGMPVNPVLEPVFLLIVGFYFGKSVGTVGGTIASKGGG